MCLHCDVTTPAKRISPSALNALREALAVIYWFLPDFESFIRAAVNHPEVVSRLNFRETKRVTAAQLVNLLAADQDRYLSTLLSLTEDVCAMEDFSHLAHLDDGASKAAKAATAVSALRKHYLPHAELSRQQQEAAAARRKSRETASGREAHATALSTLQSEFMSLVTEQAQDRGFSLERLLNRLFALFELDPKASFRRSGEQIDGAFTFEGDEFLLEAKWQREPVNSTELHAFSGKVEAGLKTTLGLFVAINGFAEVAVERHSGRGANMILVEGGDLYAVLEGRIRFDDLLRRKKRHAAQTGEVLLPIGKII